MKHLYTLGIAATIMVALAAGNPEELFQRLAFVLSALIIGYLVLRHRFRLRYYTRLQRAFNSERHLSKRWANQYRRKNHLQTA